MARTDGHEAFTDIAAGGDAHAQPVTRVLVDVGPFGAGEMATLRLAQGQDIADVVGDMAFVGGQVAREAGQQGGFAGAAFADNAQDFAGAKIKADVGAADAGAVAFGQALDCQQRAVEGGGVDGHGVASGEGKIPSKEFSNFFEEIWFGSRRVAQKSVSEQTYISLP